MEKLFIPYELALKLKEEGFNEECFGVFEKETNKFKFHEPIKNEKCGGWYSSNQCSAPIFDQAFDWFRDKHNWHISIQLNGNIPPFYYWQALSTIERDYKNNAIVSHSIYTSDREAKITCIEAMIEKIKTTNICQQ